MVKTVLHSHTVHWYYIAYMYWFFDKFSNIHFVIEWNERKIWTLLNQEQFIFFGLIFRNFFASKHWSMNFMYHLCKKEISAKHKSLCVCSSTSLLVLILFCFIFVKKLIEEEILYAGCCVSCYWRNTWRKLLLGRQKAKTCHWWMQNTEGTVMLET